MAAKINLRTGKIIGAEKGSFGWWHEKGHAVYDDSESGIRNQFLQEMLLYLTVIFIILALFIDGTKYYAVISLIIFLGLFLYEEIWCNKYAKRKLKEGRR